MGRAEGSFHDSVPGLNMSTGKSGKAVTFQQSEEEKSFDQSEQSIQQFIAPSNQVQTA
jgi:hypothetical protein